MKSKTDTASYYTRKKGKIKIALRMHMHLLLAAVAVYMLLLVIFLIRYGHDISTVSRTFILTVQSARILDTAVISLFCDAIALLMMKFFTVAVYTLPVLLLYPALLVIYKRKAEKTERIEKARQMQESRRPNIKDLF
jgi:ABC-type sulfate transport system permease component